MGTRQLYTHCVPTILAMWSMDQWNPLCVNHVTVMWMGGEVYQYTLNDPAAVWAGRGLVTVPTWALSGVTCRLNMGLNSGKFTLSRERNGCELGSVAMDYQLSLWCTLTAMRRIRILSRLLSPRRRDLSSLTHQYDPGFWFSNLPQNWPQIDQSQLNDYGLRNR